MDNLAHTLVGAALGRALAGHRLRGAALLGAVAANAPDWTELIVTPGVVPPRSGLRYVVWHRGITHSFAGAAVEIACLTLLAWVVARWWAGRTRTPAPSWHWVAACVAAAVASHLYLDWQGSYGLRPFLPWSGRWYYSDWVAIVDPFFWLVPLGALLWGERRHWWPALVGVLTLTGIALIVFLARGASVAAWLRVATGVLCVVTALGWERHWFGVAGRRRAAAYALLALAGYAAASGAASLPAKADAREAARRRFGPEAEWAALTIVGRPFGWQPIYASRDTVAGPGWAAPRHLALPVVQRVLRDTPEGRAMAQFARFLAADVDSSGDGAVVYLRDARYARGPRGGWAAVAVSATGLSAP